MRPLGKLAYETWRCIDPFGMSFSLPMCCWHCLPYSTLHNIWLFHFSHPGVSLSRVWWHHQSNCTLQSWEKLMSYLGAQHQPAARIHFHASIQLYVRIEVHNVSRHLDRNDNPGQRRITWSGYNPPVSSLVERAGEALTEPCAVNHGIFMCWDPTPICVDLSLLCHYVCFNFTSSVWDCGTPLIFFVFRRQRRPWTVRHVSVVFNPFCHGVVHIGRN